MAFLPVRTTFRVQLCSSARKIRRALVATICLFLLSLPLCAQVQTGRISGAVTDQTGGAVIGATVTVTDVARGVSRPPDHGCVGSVCCARI